MVISVDGSNFQPLSQLESATVPLLPMWISTVSSFLAKAPGTSSDHHKLVEALVWLCMSTSAEGENRANKIYHDLFELPDSINLWLFYANINFNHLSKEKYNMEMCICVSTHHHPGPSFSFLVVHFRRSLGPEKGVNHNSSAVLCAEKSGSSFGRVVVGPRIEHQQGVELSFEMAPKDTGLGRYGRAHAHLQPKVVRSFWGGGRSCWVWVSNHHITNGCNILRRDGTAVQIKIFGSLFWSAHGNAAELLRLDCEWDLLIWL